MSARRLYEQYEAWRDEGRAMVLATVIATEGSTYSKPGARMLIAGNDFQGLLSGGCLEGDVALHAAQCTAQARARVVRYDMRQREHDEIWGLGLGCDGAVDILLQPLTPQSGYQPLAALVEAARERREATLALVVDADGTGEAAIGSALVVVDGAQYTAGLDTDTAALLARRAGAVLGDTRSRRLRVGIEADARALARELDVLFTSVAPPLSLLVLGAGPDSVPVLRMASELGWYVTQADHRPGHLAAISSQAPVDHSLEVSPSTLSASLALERFDAVVIMSHHLASDRAYLTELASSPVPYIGLLGPAARRRRLLADVTEALERRNSESAGHDARWLAARTHGPAGLALGSREPAGIALSILAEIQQVHARSG
jgi:xanthine dehydrogenase accessory factor